MLDWHHVPDDDDPNRENDHREGFVLGFKIGVLLVATTYAGFFLCSRLWGP